MLECFEVLWWKVLWRLTLLVLYAHQLKMRDQWISCLVARLLRSKVCGQRAFSSHEVALVRGCASILHTRGSLAPRVMPPWSQGEAQGSAPKHLGGVLCAVGGVWESLPPELGNSVLKARVGILCEGRADKSASFEQLWLSLDYIGQVDTLNQAHLNIKQTKDCKTRYVLAYG